MMEKVRGDPVQPRQGAASCPAARPPLEGERERLGGQLIREITSGTPMEVSVNRSKVPIENQRERLRLPQ